MRLKLVPSLSGRADTREIQRAYSADADPELLTHHLKLNPTADNSHYSVLVTVFHLCPYDTKILLSAVAAAYCQK